MPTASRAGVLPYRLTIALIGVLVVSLLVDLTPRFHLGDSESYLGSEWRGYLPDDRSWIYGLLAVRLIRWTGHLDGVMLVQVAFGWGCACGLAMVLQNRLRRGAWLVVPAVIVLIANPLTFFWTRAFMTDGLAAALFGCVAGLLLWPPAQRRPVVTAVAVLVLSIAIGELRAVYLPPMLAAFAAVALAGLPRWRVERRTLWRFGLLSLAVLLAVLACGSINKSVLQRSTRSTNYAAGRFLVSAWSPVMGPVLPQLGLPAAVTDGMLPLTYDNRLAAAFAGSGLPVRLASVLGPDQAERVYARLLRRTVLTEPAAFAGLIARSWWDYLNPSRVLMYHRARWFTGTEAHAQPATLSPGFIARLMSLGIWERLDPDLPQVPSLGLSYYARLGGWWALLLSWSATLSPLAALALLRRVPVSAEAQDESRAVAALLLFGFATIAMVALSTNELVTRYLIPLDIPLLALAVWLARRRDQ